MDRIWKNEYRTTVVCIDSYTDGVFAGRFYNPSCPEGQRFSSLSQFLIKMEDMLDTTRFPQSFTAVRSFGDPASDRTSGLPTGVNGDREGRLATFSMRILFRQNASWQGSLAWLEGDREESFRSVLELILLMNSALEQAPNN